MLSSTSPNVERAQAQNRFQRRSPIRSENQPHVSMLTAPNVYANVVA